MTHIFSFLGKDSVARRVIVRFVAYWGSFFFIAAIHWLYTCFGKVTLPQIIYHLHFSTGLIKDSDSAFATTFALECLLGPTLAATLISAIERYVDSRMLARAMLTLRLRPFRRTPATLSALRRGLPLYLLFLSVAGSLWALSAYSYVRSMFGGDQFSRHYIDPTKVTVRGNAPKNLVLIYLESMEASYSDVEYFGEDLLKEMNALHGASFSTYSAVPGVSWTMAGIVATQCGIPLQFVLGIANPADGAQRIDSFLPRAVCLGDILKKNGYRNIFLGGARLNFAAKGQFLKAHGYDETFGANEWRALGVATQEFNDWGLFDDDLLRAAKARLLELNAAGSPFNLTILTVDTHQPKGHYSKLCREQGAEVFEDILRCASRQMADFMDFAKQHDLLRTTNFVMIGDHLASVNPVIGRLDRDGDRRIFNKFIAAEIPVKNRDSIVPFDLFPTVLEFIGFDVERNRLGLGCSGFFKLAEPCKVVALTEDSLGELAVSTTYRRLWSE